jgi:3-methyladenine DNA glycosylase AlkD
MTANEVLRKLKSWRNARNVAGMARFGISPKNTLGIPIPKLRALAREIGRGHTLAQQLWASGIHEARILASLVDDPALVTSAQMERWVKDFDSWDVCDQVCANLFDKTKLAQRQALAWSKRPAEFEKRAGFALMAALASHDKTAPDAAFLKFLPAIARGASDERNFVKKAVNWALRQIGKRNRALNRAAVRAARGIQKQESRAAKWVAADALRELQADYTQVRLKH